MRILLSHVYAWPEVRRGGERYLHEVGAALLRAGHDVAIATTAPTASTDEILGVPVTRYARKGDDLFAQEKAFARTLSRRNLLRSLDVWHALGTADAAAAARHGRRRHTRSVYTDLGGPLRSYRESREDHAAFEYAVENLDAYVCLSDATRTLLRDDYARDGVTVHGGVDVAHFHPRCDRSATPSVLFTSALDEPRKNLALLLEAFDELLDDTNARLVLAGPGDPAAVLDGASDRVRQAVEVLDPATDLVDAYSSAWVTVLPSMREAFGLVLVESLACGTPIVAIAGSGGPAEIVKPGIGALATEATRVALAAALRDGLALSDRDACRREATTHYSWDDAIVPQLLRVYEG